MAWTSGLEKDRVCQLASPCISRAKASEEIAVFWQQWTLTSNCTTVASFSMNSFFYMILYLIYLFCVFVVWNSQINKMCFHGWEWWIVPYPGHSMFFFLLGIVSIFSDENAAGIFLSLCHIPWGWLSTSQWQGRRLAVIGTFRAVLGEIWVCVDGLPSPPITEPFPWGQGRVRALPHGLIWLCVDALAPLPPSPSPSGRPLGVVRSGSLIY